MRTISRQDAIDQLRTKLLTLVDDDHSICDVAAEKRIFCHGFSQWSDSELARRLHWMIDRKKPRPRAILEAHGNRWQLARQEVLGLPLACDVQQIDRDQCLGWESFDNGELEEHYRELIGERVTIG
jgi:hypothetical protein